MGQKMFLHFQHLLTPLGGGLKEDVKYVWERLAGYCPATMKSPRMI